MDLSYGYYLCLDTATIFPQVGVLGGGKWVYFKRFENARADVLWEPLKECFRNFSWSGFIYNAGPGGMLGLHSTLMMIRIWKMLALYRT
ncbi:MAG: hypothetical protein LBG98_01150, partial [Puniceicoccales bacterium]|nr:hypothetical protein [Puniceicoccales bacterium]